MICPVSSPKNLQEENGTFQIPVDSAEETSGGDMMVIARES
jgi:hypothetical protein